MQIIKVKPNKNGDIIIRLFGTDYKIVVDNETTETTKKGKKAK